MSIFSKFENKMEDKIEGIGGLFKKPISPVNIMREAEKQMCRNLVLGSGKRIAPTLYTVLMNATDDDALFNYYPSLAGEAETFLKAKANQEGFAMECKPLVRFFREESLKQGRFEIIAEMVSAVVIDKLRKEELELYGISENQINSMTPDRSSSSDPFENVTFDKNKVNFNQDTFGSELESKSQVSAKQSIPKQKIQSDKENSNFETQVISSSQGKQAILIETLVGREYLISKNLFTLGRDKSNDIVVSDINVSRHHSEIAQRINGSWYLIDKNSTNGTFLNGEKIEQHILSNGDKISLGNSQFQFFIK